MSSSANFTCTSQIIEIIDAKLVFMLLWRMSHASGLLVHKRFVQSTFTYTLKDEINTIRLCLYRTFLSDVWCKINSDSLAQNFKPC